MVKKSAAFATLFLLLCYGNSLFGGPPCTTSDYKGVFSAVALGEFISTPPGIPVGPTARIGRVEADGNGNARIHAVLSLNGVILEEDYGGLYSVKQDCTMEVVLMIPFPGVPAPVPFRFSGMLADGGREAVIILLDPPGSTVRIALRKQRRETCSVMDLLGSYALNMSGSNVFQPGMSPGAFARVGRVQFDLAFGRLPAFRATTQASFGGRIVAEDFSGQYSVDAQCNVVMSYSTPDNSHVWSGMIMDDGAGVNLIVKAPAGAVITGTLKAQ